MTAGIGPKVKAKIGSATVPTVEEVKTWMKSPNGVMKSGAGHWWLNNMEVGDKTAKLPASNLRVVNIDGIPVGLMKMRFGYNTQDISGLAGQQLILVNAFVGSGANIKPVKIGRCYLANKTDIATAESFSLVSAESGAANIVEDWDNF